MRLAGSRAHGSPTPRSVKRRIICASSSRRIRRSRSAHAWAVVAPVLADDARAILWVPARGMIGGLAHVTSGIAAKLAAHLCQLAETSTCSGGPIPSRCGMFGGPKVAPRRSRVRQPDSSREFRMVSRPWQGSCTDQCGQRVDGSARQRPLLCRKRFQSP